MSAGLAVTGIGLGFADKDGPSEGQGALTDVRHSLPTNEFAPEVARFRMSTPLLVEGWSKSTCTAGFSSDEVRPEKVALDSRRQKDPVRISNNYVLLDYVSRIRGTGKTDAKVRPLRC